MQGQGEQQHPGVPVTGAPIQPLPSFLGQQVVYPTLPKRSTTKRSGSVGKKRSASEVEEGSSVASSTDRATQPAGTSHSPQFSAMVAPAARWNMSLAELARHKAAAEDAERRRLERSALMGTSRERELL